MTNDSRLPIADCRFEISNLKFPIGIRHSTIGNLLLVLAALMLCGCAAPPQERLPTYPWTDDATALRQMRQRAELVQTVNSACSLTLTRANGQSIRLDGALAMSLPNKSVRLRAWKFNQAVFDLTLTPQGLWLEIPHDQSRRPELLPASLNAAQMARALALFGSDIFSDPKIQFLDAGGPEFQFAKPLENGQMLVAQVNRSTLTVRRFRLLGPSGGVRFSLTLSDYREFPVAGVWPMKLVAADSGSDIDVQFRDIAFNTPLPPRAFIPPRGAQKVP